jgi:hypothetical protein
MFETPPRDLGFHALRHLAVGYGVDGLIRGLNSLGENSYANSTLPTEVPVLPNVQTVTVVYDDKRCKWAATRNKRRKEETMAISAEQHLQMYAREFTVLPTVKVCSKTELLGKNNSEEEVKEGRKEGNNALLSLGSVSLD